MAGKCSTRYVREIPSWRETWRLVLVAHGKIRDSKEGEHSYVDEE